MEGATLELDLWWMLPAVSSRVEGKSLLQIAAFILAPTPRALEPPVVKAFMFLATPVVGLSLKALILISLVVHCASAFLLYRVLRQCGLSARGSFFTGGFYFALSANFHAYLWPVGFQHLFAVFTILLTLHLYLAAENRMRARSGGYPWAYGAALGAALLASLQRSALIAPGLILMEILVRPRKPGERLALYRRWFPLFAVSLLYPAWALTLCDDGILTGMILHSGLPTAIQDFLLPSGFTARPFPHVPKYLLLLGAGLAGLLGLGALLGALRRWGRAGKPILAASLLLAGLALFGFQDRRQLLFPYNAGVPFVTTLASFLYPMRMALTMDSTEMGYTLPAQISPLLFYASLFLVVVFGARFAARKRRLLLFPAWYLLCLGFLLRYQYSFFPVICPSRYFVYLSPFVGAAFCPVIVTVYLKIARRIRLRPSTREILLLGAFTLLALANLAAARVAAWRGKVVNTFYLYEDLRAAWLIRASLEPALARSRGAPLAVSVEGAEPLPLEPLGEANYPYADPARYDHLRIALREALGGRGFGRVRINEGAQPGSSLRYVIQARDVLGPDGQRVDPFGRLLEEGVARMVGGQNERALSLFGQAVRMRPFLLRYGLSPGLRLEDLRWLTQGEEFREWLRDIHARWFTKTAKWDRIRSVMEEELAEYTRCLFYLSYVEAQEGHEERSRYWLSQIQHVDRDPERLISLISKDPVVSQDARMAAFVQRFSDGTTFEQPLPWRKDDYGFERFLARLLLHWDFPSAWDVRAGSSP